jgi:hypothetical protein
METHADRQARKAKIEAILRAAWREVGAAWWQEKLFAENGAEGLIGMGGYLDPYLFAAQCGAWPVDRALADHADLLHRIEPYRRCLTRRTSQDGRSAWAREGSLRGQATNSTVRVSRARGVNSQVPPPARRWFAAFDPATNPSSPKCVEAGVDGQRRVR